MNFSILTTKSNLKNALKQIALFHKILKKIYGKH